MRSIVNMDMEIKNLTTEGLDLISFILQTSPKLDKFNIYIFPHTKNEILIAIPVDETVYGYKSDNVVKELKSLGIFEMPIEDKTISELYLIRVNRNVAEYYLKKQTNLSSASNRWKWFDKKAGVYQFDDKQFQQKGKIRKKVFTACMDIYEKSPDAISISSLKEMTGEKPERIRIEISAINNRLSETGYKFKGSGKGYYTLKKTS